MNRKDLTIALSASAVSAIVGAFGGAALSEYRHDYNPGFSLLPDLGGDFAQFHEFEDTNAVARDPITGQTVVTVDPLTGIEVAPEPKQ